MGGKSGKSNSLFLPVARGPTRQGKTRRAGRPAGKTGSVGGREHGSQKRSHLHFTLARGTKKGEEEKFNSLRSTNRRKQKQRELNHGGRDMPLASEFVDRAIGEKKREE